VPVPVVGTVEVGCSFPLGATIAPGGVNFSVYSRNATGLELLLFDDAEDVKPARAISLDPLGNRTASYWHVFVPGLAPGQLYGYRAQGPYLPDHGLRFDPRRTLLDPYGRGVVVPAGYTRRAAMSREEPSTPAMKSVVVDVRAYDWDGDAPPKTAFDNSAIYEMHVAGFTRHPSSGLALHRRGTYAGAIEKIPYLRDLGITAVELLPVFQFDAQDAPAGLVNYWGYAPISFFAPHQAYSSRKDPLGPLDEFRDLVKALHRAGIEVILDVVYNHTAEGGGDGPTLCFRGLENEAYYILDADSARYADYTGTGNTLNANHPIVRRLIVDSLHYWVEVMHVDGFRFDLASVLSRDESGRPEENPPVLWDIASDPVLAGTKLIAEAWDAAGLYQVGHFIGDRWKEWNGQFRDDLRRFVKGDNGMVRSFAQRVLGSPDLFGDQQRGAGRSVNFVTCHDGFTLTDLVSYNVKHNEANGEGNRDGSDANWSWNCGAEGPTDDPAIAAIRERQVKNFLALTLVALGTPMLSMGDEVRRTQRGNNNAYCQDNELSWFDWTLVDRHRDLHRFVKTMTAHRLSIATARGPVPLSLNRLLCEGTIQCHGVKLGEPDWGDDSHSLAFTIRHPSRQWWHHFIVNAYWKALAFELPGGGRESHGAWRRLIDTSLASPQDICEASAAPVVEATTYVAQPRSVVALFAEAQEE